MATTVAFYRDVMGLPVLRESPDETRFWAGDLATLTIATGGAPPPRYTDRMQGAVMPVFRVYDFHAFVAEIKALGFPFITERDLIQGVLSYFLDPAGEITGLQERFRTSTRREDHEAFRRHDAGPERLGDLTMPARVQSFGWICRWVADAPAAVRFYHDVLGLPIHHPTNERGATMLRLGAISLNEIKRGLTTPQPPPTDWRTVSNMMVLRVVGLDALCERLARQGAHVVQEPEPFDGMRLAVIADPEGQVVGLREAPADTDDPV
ncbi:MAG: VOC family protein, partial [Thermomicrobium sp.]|nr:VOC family protein [Thermomicrobium sp.]